MNIENGCETKYSFLQQDKHMQAGIYEGVGQCLQLQGNVWTHLHFSVQTFTISHQAAPHSTNPLQVLGRNFWGLTHCSIWNSVALININVPPLKLRVGQSLYILLHTNKIPSREKKKFIYWISSRRLVVAVKFQ